MNKEGPLKAGFDELTKKFNLKSSNLTLDCIDISHHSGGNAKAGIVRFNSNGPDKRLYRSFNMPKELGGNDPGSLAFAIKKRLKKIDHNPSIVLVDGGKVQLNAITSKIKNKNILILAIEKGSHRRVLTETIYSKNGQESVRTDSSLFKLLTRARDEAHRFAVKHNRISKQKNVKKSKLDEIEGIGPIIKGRLFKKFGSFKSIKKASVNELVLIKGINKSLASRIRQSL